MALVIRSFRRLLSDRRGNFGMMVALIFLPMVIGLGISVDYVRAWNAKARMQVDLDAALIASVKEVDNLDEDELKKQVETWFAAQTRLDSSSYALSSANIAINKTDKTIEATATATISTVFLGIINIDSIPISVVSAAEGPSTSYLEVHIAIDKSASMLLAATSDGQTALRAQATCEFACHTNEKVTYTYGGNSYTTVYDLSVAMGIELRADVSVTAVRKLISLIETANSSSSHIKIALYTLGSSATQVLSPTYSTSTAEKYLNDDSYNLTSATSEATSYFDQSLPQLVKLVGSAGDGESEKSPLKLLLLLTDGVESSRPFVVDAYSTPKSKCTQYSGTVCIKYNSAHFKNQGRVTPLNPDWCTSFKDKGVTVGVLYTEYLSIPLDWGYNMTVGETMSSSSFSSYWGGTMRSDVSSSIARRDYIPYALKDCATSEDLFLAANDQDKIESGLASIFEQYTSSLRLTK